MFSSGFEGASALNAPSDFYGTGAWQDIVGADSTTGFTWPGNIWGGRIRLQMTVDGPVDATTIGNYMVNRIETVTGHDGRPTRALYSELKQKGKRVLRIPDDRDRDFRRKLTGDSSRT